MQPDRVVFGGGYVLVYPDGSLAALDRVSGGYPYKTHLIPSAQIWLDVTEAKQYRQMFAECKFELRPVIGLALGEPIE